MKFPRARLVFVFILLAVLLVFLSPAGFVGTDEQATEMIEQIHEGYTPWFEPVWAPAGVWQERLLFALQAALGAAFLGYYLGRLQGAASTRPERRDARH